MKKTMAVLGAVALTVGLAFTGAAPAFAGSRGNDAPPSTSTEDKPAVGPMVTPDPIQCVVESSSVDAGSTTFTVGPTDCNVATAEISFSTYSLPSGMVQPFADQVLFDSATSAGVAYTVGTYTLTANLPECNWQSDLYWSPNGQNKPEAPHSHPISGMNVGWDFTEGNDCTPAPVTTETVVFAQHSCDALGTVVAPAVEGVHYSEVVDGTVVGTVENFPAGSFFATDDGTATGLPFYGDITITASAEDGYTLSDGSVTVWAFTFTKPADCGTVVVPPKHNPPKSLAYTGANDVTGWLIPFGVGLFLLGGAGLLLGRRRMVVGK